MPTIKIIDKLKKDLAVDVIGQQIKPKKDTFEDEQDSQAEKIPKADSNVNYPVINELEKRVFNKDYKTIEVTQRLTNLEQNVFKKTYNDDLNARVDRLKTAVMPEKNFTADSNDDAGRAAPAPATGPPGCGRPIRSDRASA